MSSCRDVGACTLNKVHDGLVGVWVLKRCNIALRLVQYEVYVLLALQLLVVEAHLVGRQNLGAKLGDYLTINGNYAGKYKVVGLTT